jgi:glycosyltransferase involved in cell wall biosynthesis
VATFHPSGIRADELRAAGVPILHLPVTSFLSFSALRGGFDLIRYIRRYGIQIIHAFDVPSNIFAVPFGRIARVPVVLSSQRAHRELTPGLYTKLLRLTDQMVDGTVVNCVHMREHLINDERVSPGQIHLCYNGIDLSLFNRCREPAEVPDPSVITIGTVCALRAEKGLPTLIEAFALTNRVQPKTRLLMVGSGPMLPHLEARAEALGVRALCTFVHKTANVAPWMLSMDIFVLPSLSEALSNSLMEAMACGCCCIASDVGGNPELMGQNTRGLLFPKGDAASLAARLCQLAGNTVLRNELSAAGHNYIHSRFSQSQSVRTMSEIYNAACP